MKLCQYCGREMVDEAMVCPNCGAAVANSQQMNQGYGQPMNQGYGQPVNQGYGQPMNQGYGQPMMNQGYGQPVNQGYGQPMGYPEFQQPEKTGLATAALVFAILFPFVGLILSIVGMSKYKTEAMKKKCKTSLIVSIVVWAINFIILML